MVGLRDVAARTGVSLMTVSNVVNNRRDKVSHETFERVREAIDELDYVPNAQARSLSAGRTHMIGMIMRNPTGPGSGLRNPHDSLLLAAVEREANRAGLSFVLSMRDDVVEAARDMSSWQIDGLIVHGSVAEEVDTLLRRSSKPIVFIDNYSHTEGLENIGVADEDGGRLLGRHLGEHGHRRILFAGPVHATGGVVGHRLAGVRAGLKEGAGEEACEVRTVDVGADEEDVRAVVDEVRVSGATAVVAYGDLLGVPLVPALQDAGLRVPEDVSVAGFDDSEACTWVRPRLSSVHQDIVQKGREAVARLRSLIEEPEGERQRPVPLSVSLSARESTGPAPGCEDEASAEGRMPS